MDLHAIVKTVTLDLSVKPVILFGWTYRKLMSCKNQTLFLVQSVLLKNNVFSFVFFSFFDRFPFSGEKFQIS